jgi:2-polyprenyl-3-methyl-5-hydroxy-6-metoxy-1,4-benzoquinol methylase
LDYAGKSILDVGCNMGVLAYEIAKLQPRKIHGIDHYRPHINVARMIFTAVPVESRFDCRDLGSRRLPRHLDASYDIVLFLAVFNHLQAGLGKEKTVEVLRLIADRCADAIVVRTTERTEQELLSLLTGFGFQRTWSTTDGGPSGPFFVMGRNGGSVTGPV